MRTLSSALEAAIGAAVQRPAFLIELNLSTVYRLSTYATIVLTNTWTADDVNVDALRVAALRVTGSIVLGNADGAWGAIALSDGFTDKVIRVYGYDAGGISTGADAVLLVTAVGGAVEVGEDAVRVALRHPAELQLAPRALVSPAYGFNTFIPAGRTLTINGVSYVISRGR